MAVAAQMEKTSSALAGAILSVNNIEVIYDHVILVLKGVSLDVPKGGIVALLGANGAHLLLAAGGVAGERVFTLSQFGKIAIDQIHVALDRRLAVGPRKGAGQ